jgi:hypothetical protein
VRQRLSKRNEEKHRRRSRKLVYQTNAKGMKSTEVKIRIYPLRASGYAGTSLLSSANLV